MTTLIPRTATEIGPRLRKLAAADLPLPGSGRTWRRFERLASIAALDLSLGRLFEGHTDALAILAEAGREPVAGAIYGVWAARSGNHGVEAAPRSTGWTLSGTKPFCSGAGMLDRALVTAEAPDGYRLFDIAVEEQVTGWIDGSWPAVGMADSASQTAVFGGPPVRPDQAIGGPDFYTVRPGFWAGAVGVAACWYGGAKGLVGRTMDLMSAGDVHALAALGRAAARIRAMHDVLRAEAQRIDDGHAEGEIGARAVREVVHDLCTAVLGEVSAAGGARPLCHDREQAQRGADLYVYLAQHHASDPATLARLVLAEPRWS